MGMRILEWIFDHIMSWVMVAFCLFIALVVIVAPIAIYHEATAETFDLKKDEWECGGGHNRDNTTFVKSGNVMVPIHSESFECDQWNRRQK